MATATKNTKIVTTVTSITLELTEDEAYAVKLLVGKVGGYPNAEFRALTDKVSLALGSADINYGDRRYAELERTVTGGFNAKGGSAGYRVSELPAWNLTFNPFK